MRLALGQNPFLSSDIIDRCKNVGILTVIDFLSVDPETLCQKISVPYKDVASIRNVFLGTYSSFLQTGENLYEELLQCFSILTTGCIRLDELLGGGIYTGEITAIHGGVAAGKTQLCISIIANLLLETDNTFIYLDSTGGFTVHRLQQIMKRKTLDPQVLVDKLKLLRIIYVYDVHHFFKVLHSIKDALLKQEDSFYSRLKLLVVDSLTPIFSPCFSDNNFEGPGLLATAAQQIKLLCREHALSFVVCNNMVPSGASLKPALGRYWTYPPSVTLYIKKTEEAINSQRCISLIKSCRKEAGGELTIAIANEGISSL